MIRFGGHSMVALLKRVIVKTPAAAFQDDARIQREWKAFGWTEPPDLQRASIEHEALVGHLRDEGVEVLSLPPDDRTGIDSIYTHDPTLITDAGIIVFQTGERRRRGEGPACADALERWGIPVLGRVDGAATAEGGDLVWLDRHTLLAGRGFRTNAAGIAALRQLLSPLGVEVIEVQLPYWNGPQECLHLMSFMSMLDDDLAVVYTRQMPVPVFELLTSRGIQTVEIPEEELPTQACNVLAVAPRRLVMLRGSPVTRERLERAGCVVHEIDGFEMSFKGLGGPTCLTRPVWREP